MLMATGQQSQRTESRRVFCGPSGSEIGDRGNPNGARSTPALAARYRPRVGIPISDCDQVHECTCSNSMVSRYQKRISGPLLDRIDIHMDVPRVEYEKVSDDLSWSNILIRSSHQGLFALRTIIQRGYSFRMADRRLDVIFGHDRSKVALGLSRGGGRLGQKFAPVPSW